jgi:hypothetical protein
MLDTFNFANPQTCNYQEFYGGGTTLDWVKPRGVAMVRMMLLGAGGGATGGRGAGSGAVTQWIGPAIFIPDVLRISIGAGGGSGAAGGATSVIYQQKNGTGYTLLTAGGGPTGGGGARPASANNYFGAAGIFSSIAGQAGSTTNITASATTFLSGGAGNDSQVATKYGYPTVAAGTVTSTDGKPGYFITQPILLGTGGSGAYTGVGVGGNGGIGCGGGAGSTNGKGGDGAVFIWSW